MLLPFPAHSASSGQRPEAQRLRALSAQALPGPAPPTCGSCPCIPCVDCQTGPCAKQAAVAAAPLKHTSLKSHPPGIPHTPLGQAAWSARGSGCCTDGGRTGRRANGQAGKWAGRKLGREADANEPGSRRQGRRTGGRLPKGRMNRRVRWQTRRSGQAADANRQAGGPMQPLTHQLLRDCYWHRPGRTEPYHHHPAIHATRPTPGPAPAAQSHK